MPKCLSTAGWRPTCGRRPTYTCCRARTQCLDWLRCTVLPPLLAKLSASDIEEFSTQLAAELRRAYPPGPSGTQFPVRRVFAVGRRP